MARVLVAEDEVLIRVDIVETLEEGGHTVVGEAGDGEQAMRLARELGPDLVVMDVRCHQGRRLTAARQINARVPRIDLTAFSDKDWSRRRRAGTIGYLFKPFSGPAAGRGERRLARAARPPRAPGTVDDLESKLAARKVIEMPGTSWSSSASPRNQAYTRMRRAAMDRQLPCPRSPSGPRGLSRRPRPPPGPAGVPRLGRDQDAEAGESGLLGDLEAGLWPRACSSDRLPTTLPQVSSYHWARRRSGVGMVCMAASVSG